MIATSFQVGYLAIGIGWLIGKAVSMGAGNCDSFKLKLISVGIAVLTMMMAEYFIISHFVSIELSKYDPSLQMPSGLHLLSLDIQHDPFTLVFWLFALFAAFRGCTAH